MSSYTADTTRCLALTSQYDLSVIPEASEFNNEVLKEAAKIIAATVGKVREEDLCIENVEIDEKVDFTFDVVNSRPAPESWQRFPVVIQIYSSKKAPTKLFIKGMTNLALCDGVTTLHTCFNVMEFLESRTNSEKDPSEFLSKYPFTTSNQRREFDEAKMGAHLGTLEKYGKAFDPAKHDPSGPLPVGPARAGFEDGLPPRVWEKQTVRDKPGKAVLKDVMHAATSIQTQLGLSSVFFTVNFSPNVALGRMEDIADTLVHEKRWDSMITPVGHPEPMNADHAAFLSYSIFWNNYGRHNPKIRSEVVACTWNWVGFAKSFTPLLWFATIQDKGFIVSSLAEADHTACARILSGLGQGERFAEMQRENATEKVSTDSGEPVQRKERGAERREA
uniref:Uncharacterized protein n=1 Tax=Chromera velia CCMP2878 TaxID=1169474 RepID=A0A0G4I1Q1_9ALVE|eukprot:Cvel_1683.t1-p1 / transcript=Cvel_1683.t1 / gene=Cvel_1683 / organism=Chromera_velia_CCMP2878 / gene_product=hypothetical protein / transcript_product=hypothetical protein / location=Cvel_scaffold60:110844-112120(+) / protein_length=390 / sequence_SO=supercontig / SO=protein_coding / is_pseudo=false